MPGGVALVGDEKLGDCSPPASLGLPCETGNAFGDTLGRFILVLGAKPCGETMTGVGRA